MGVDALCGACARERPVFGRARAAFRYDEDSKDLILRFKHADRTDAAPAFARWLARAGNPYLGEIDAIAALAGPGAYALNTSYEWCCTSGVGDDPEGGVRLLHTYRLPIWIDGVDRCSRAASFL